MVALKFIFYYSMRSIGIFMPFHWTNPYSVKLDGLEYQKVRVIIKLSFLDGRRLKPSNCIVVMLLLRPMCGIFWSKMGQLHYA